MRDKMMPLVAGLVGVISGVYIFQPIVLQQLKRDGNLNPVFDEDEKITRERLGDLTDQTTNNNDVSK